MRKRPEHGGLPRGCLVLDLVRPEDVPDIVREHFVGGRPVARLVRYTDNVSLHAEVTQTRDAAIAAMKAREAAGAVPDDLTSTVRGFQDSRIVLTALELDLFTHTRAPVTASPSHGPSKPTSERPKIRSTPSRRSSW